MRLEYRGVNRAAEWSARLLAVFSALLIFLTLSGLSIWLLPFSVANQLLVLAHIGFGVLFLVPCVWYVARHWALYRRHAFTHIQVEGYVAGIALLACGVSGVVLTVEAIWGARITYLWDAVHIVTTVATIAFAAMHLGFLIVREMRGRTQIGGDAVVAGVGRWSRRSAAGVLALGAATAAVLLLYRPLRLHNEFPPDYSFSFGADRPFAPSLARTDTGNAFDPRSLAGSESCGTAGCHAEIYREWSASAHRYAAMDLAFQVVQKNMAQQNGPDSTRYCGGCHDPISIFAGAKTIFADASRLTSEAGYQEGVSCLVCHAVRETDVKGNANYVITQPRRYMFELEYAATRSAAYRVARDILIRGYPRQHVASLSKRLFKSPEYCAACHKQFIDQEINNVGWVQLQNQYDNWRKSKWNHPGDPARTIECRECHMPLQPSNDPASGDSADYNRGAGDGKHRGHRFIAANQMMPALLKLEGWQEQIDLTQRWLRGEFDIPEIASKWAQGRAVGLDLLAPGEVHPGERIELRAVLTANKVGHDFPTGPLDIIQAWVELVVTDEGGRELLASGKVDARGFIQPGSFMFKAEPVDQAGNLIDRHNLWEMVGVRHRRALFPGFSDTASYELLCPDLAPGPRAPQRSERAFTLEAPGAGASRIVARARLRYRKVDQYLLNFVFGEKAGVTAPITDMASMERSIQIAPARRAGD